MSDYYAKKLKGAEAWERYIVTRFMSEGSQCIRHETFEDQIAYGDIRIGGEHVELKYDEIHARTKNLFIEVAEKRYADQPEWWVSGIYARSAATLYGVGDYRDLFLFRRDDLRRFEQQLPRKRIKTIGRGTSQGFAMNPSERIGLEPQVWHWPDVCADGTPASAAGEPAQVVVASTFEVERSLDVASGYCLGCAISGGLPWCAICRWSPTYMLRSA